jgi:hypothetical protein
MRSLCGLLLTLLYCIVRFPTLVLSRLFVPHPGLHPISTLLAHMCHNRYLAVWHVERESNGTDFISANHNNNQQDALYEASTSKWFTKTAQLVRKWKTNVAATVSAGKWQEKRCGWTVCCLSSSRSFACIILAEGLSYLFVPFDAGAY